MTLSDKYLGLVEALGETFPGSRWQRCVVHFYRNAFSVVPKGKVKEVTAMLKMILGSARLRHIAGTKWGK